MFWLLEKIVLSIVFILSIHYLLLYFQANLTIPKQKDMFYAPIKKYNKMYEIIKQRDNQQDNSSISCVDDKETMKNELKEFIEKKLRT
jgi:hypothetical protein